jgi:hypothetical protein
MTNAQQFMTAIEEENQYNRYAVIALRKEVVKLENKVKYLDKLLDECITEKTL